MRPLSNFATNLYELGHIFFYLVYPTWPQWRLTTTISAWVHLLFISILEEQVFHYRKLIWVCCLLSVQSARYFPSFTLFTKEDFESGLTGKMGEKQNKTDIFFLQKYISSLKTRSPKLWNSRMPLFNVWRVKFSNHLCVQKIDFSTEA